MADNMVLCIARQFGSGGREIGLALAEVLGLRFYDRELLKAAADKSGILQELFEKSDEKPVRSLAAGSVLPGVPAKATSYADYISYMPNDQMQAVIADVIREAASDGPCVIIGRCADYILRGHKNAVSIYIHADLEKRVHRIARLHNLDEDAARALVRKTDRARANYYSYYTDQSWGAGDSYHLAIDAGRLGTQAAVTLLQNAVPLFCR